MKTRAWSIAAEISTWKAIGRDATGSRNDLRPVDAALPDAVVFDNDGLLLDTESVWTRAEEDLFERRGHEFTPADKRELVGSSAAIAGGILERRLGEPGRAAELIEELNELVVAELEHGVEAMVGARELLEALVERGTPLALVSNSPMRLRPPLAADRRPRGLLRRRSSAPTKSRRRSRRPTPISRPAGGSASSPGPTVVALEDSPTRRRRRRSPPASR